MSDICGGARGPSSPCLRRGEGGHASGRERAVVEAEGTGNKICARRGGNNEGSVSGEQERSEGEADRERSTSLRSKKRL